MRTCRIAILCLLSATAIILTGCSSSMAAPGPFLYTAIEPTFPGASIVTFAQSATGAAVAPASSTGVIAAQPFGVHQDAAGNIYLATVPVSTFNLTVGVYTSAAGVLSLARSFTFTLPSALPNCFAVDSTGIVYISLHNGTMLKFAAGATGAATPVATITFAQPFAALATDASGNLYGYTSGAVTEYLSGFTTSTPSKTMTLSGLTSAADLALDTAGNLYLAGTAPSGTSTPAPTIFEYPATNGTVSPIRTISGAATLFNSPLALTVSASGKIYVEDISTTSTSSTTLNDIFTFSANATGNVAPASSFTTGSNNAANVGLGLVVQ